MKKKNRTPSQKRNLRRHLKENGWNWDWSVKKWTKHYFNESGEWKSLVSYDFEGAISHQISEDLKDCPEAEE